MINNEIQLLIMSMFSAFFLQPLFDIFCQLALFHYWRLESIDDGCPSERWFSFILPQTEHLVVAADWFGMVDGV